MSAVAVAGVTALAAIGLAAGSALADCDGEAAALVKAETELPVLDLTPPLHHELVCITLETLVNFGKRLGAHVARCPASPHADKAATWERLRKDYLAKFRQRRCRRHL